MRTLACLALLVGVVPLLSAAPPTGDARKAAPMKVLRGLRYGTKIDLTITVAETGETVQRKGEFVVWDQLALRAFSAEGKGAITAVIHLPDTGDRFTLRTAGLAEDLYVVHVLHLQKPFAKWFKKAREGVKHSPDVVIGDPYRPSKAAEEFDRVPAYLLSAVAAAAVKYEEKRAELFVRLFNENSYLYFPPAGEASWRVIRDGDRLIVRTRCVDRMYVAGFEVEFRKAGAGDGEWEYVRLRGEQKWKGE